MFTLPKLPYAYDALEPVISERTMKVHHDKHHGAYVHKTNELTARAGMTTGESLEAVIRYAVESGDRTLFNNAAQAWNHGFFWAAMTPKPQTPEGALAKAMETSFGGLAALKTAFVKEGAEHFGSGWVWLAADRSNGLVVRATHDADDTVMHPELTPLIVCDLWEHAYYLDHQNDRKGFLEGWFDRLPHWEFAAYQLAAAMGAGKPWLYPAPRGDAEQKRAGAR